MAGRIRTLKPELREHVPFASLSDAAARLFLLLPSIADDEGRCPASPTYLAGAVFFGRPRTAASVAKLLRELEAAHLIAPYDTASGPYLEILGWRDKGSVTHQRIEKRQPGRYPAPEGHDSRNEPGTVTDDSGTDPTSDLRPPISDHDREREPARANQDSGSAQTPAPPVQATSWQRGNAWWQHMLEAHRRVRASGILPNAPDPTGSYLSYEREMNECARWLRTAGRDESGVDDGMRHVALVAEAEAMREGHLEFFKPRMIWDLDRFKRAIDTSIEEARTPRRRGPAPSQGRQPNNEPRIHHEEL